MRRLQEVFYFKQFGIEHDRCAHKVGTDSVLLGAWANCSHASSILDIGSGSGILSLMMAQRCSASIDAVEIDEESLLQSKTNVSTSPWPDRIHFFHKKIQEFHPGKQYDLIITNPPYFVSSLRPTDTRRSGTRHTHELSFDELVSNANRLLKNNGTLNLVLPPNEFQQLASIAADSGLFPIRRLLFRAKASKPIERVLAEFKRHRTACEDEQLILFDELNAWTESYKKLTRAFHPNL